MNLYNIHPDPENAPYREWAFENVPELVWDRFTRGIGYFARENGWRPKEEGIRELKKREAVFTKDPKYAFLYAKHVLKGRFRAGEAALAKDPWYAWLYAHGVLKKRFPAGEITIAGSSYAEPYWDEFLESASFEVKAFAFAIVLVISWAVTMYVL